MPSHPIQAFVSSTYQDLKDHRAHVIKGLRKSGIFVDPMEEWTAESDEPKVFSSKRVMNCHFCVLLVAFRRGYVPKKETQSITQLEYQAAIAHDIDVLVYLLDENASWPPQYNELKRDPKLQKWRTELEQRHGRELFQEDPSSIDILPAVVRWFEKHQHPVIVNLGGLANELANHKVELRGRRRDVVYYLEHTRDLIQLAHDELEAGRVPHGTCQQLYDTGELLVRAIGHDVSFDDHQRLMTLLKGAYAVEELYIRNEKDRQINLAELDRIRGSFAALVEAIRVSPPARRPWWKLW